MVVFTPKKTAITPAGQSPVRTSFIHFLDRIQAGRIKRQPVTHKIWERLPQVCSVSKPDTGNKPWLQRTVSQPGCLLSTDRAVSLSAAPPPPHQETLRKHLSTNKHLRGKGRGLSSAAPSRPRPRHGGPASRSLPQQRPGGAGAGSANQRRACCGARERPLVAGSGAARTRWVRARPGGG